MGHAGPSEDGAVTLAVPDAAQLPALVDEHRTYKAIRALTVPVFKFVWGLQIEGAHRVPDEGPVILAANHRSNFDSIVLPRITRRPVNFMAKREFFTSPHFSRFLAHMGAFPVDRGRPDKAATEHALDVLRAGGVLALYPEGTRRSGSEIGTVARGTVWLAQRANAQIVPVGIGGSEFTQPKGSKRIHRMRIRIVVGDPLPPPVSRGREALASRNTELVKTIQELFLEAGGPGPTPLRRDRSAPRWTKRAVSG